MADKKQGGFWGQLMQIDRRVIFVAVALSVSVPLFLDISQPIFVSQEVEDLYASLEALPTGSKVLIACDYDPPSAPELQPMAIAVVTYCLERDLKMIVVGLWPQGPLQFNQALTTVIGATPGDEFTYNGKTFRYGEDWVNLGFQEGREFVIQRMGSSFEGMFPKDYSGKPYGDFPLLRGVTNFSNIDYIFNLSAGYPGTVEWVQLAGDRYQAIIGAANTAVQAPMVYPYYRAGQLTGILGGMKGAAEFEKRVGIKGKATKFMLSQSFAHAIIILFILVGNIAFFVGGRRSRLKDNA